MITSIAAPFSYHAPGSVEEASRLLSRYSGNARLLAGGHSLLPLMKLRLASPEALIDLGRVDGLSGIRESGDGIAVGAMTTYADITRSDLVAERAPALAEAAAQVADTPVRNAGTIGGSIAHADPAGDLPAVVLALGAQIHARSARASRTIDVDRFFRDFMTTALRPNEVLTEIHFPGRRRRHGFGIHQAGEQGVPLRRRRRGRDRYGRRRRMHGRPNRHHGRGTARGEVKAGRTHSGRQSAFRLRHPPGCAKRRRGTRRPVQRGRSRLRRIPLRDGESVHRSRARKRIYKGGRLGPVHTNTASNMRATVMNPKNSASSLSKREKMRRKPFNRRNRRSTSLRLLYNSLLYCHGATRVESGGNDGHESQLQCKLACLVTLVCTVHHQSRVLLPGSQAVEQFAPFRCVMGLTRGKGEGHRCSSIRGNHMNLGGPPAPGLADGLRSVFFNAPVPSGCTLTMVLSIETASSLTRTICSRCRYSNTLSSTPLLAQRFMRV